MIHQRRVLEDSNIKVRIIKIIEPKGTYIPSIDPISKKLVMAKPDKKNNVWDHLYNMDRELKEKHDQSYLEKKLKEEQDSLKGCTFKPEIIGQNSSLIDPSYNEEDIYKRSQQWRQNLDEKYC